MPAPSAAPPIDSDCFALLDDCHATAAAPSSRLYGGLVRVHRCADPCALEEMWAAVDADLRTGLHAVVTLSQPGSLPRSEGKAKRLLDQRNSGA